MTPIDDGTRSVLRIRYGQSKVWVASWTPLGHLLVPDNVGKCPVI